MFKCRWIIGEDFSHILGSPNGLKIDVNCVSEDLERVFCISSLQNICHICFSFVVFVMLLFFYLPLCKVLTLVLKCLSMKAS